ncbi:cupredoxin domain-containing protein [Luteimonas sp. A649]
MSRGVRRAAALGVAAVLASAVAWAAFAPVAGPPTREKAFIIPEGTWERRMAGEELDILPQRIRLTLGVNDVLRLENRDTVPQTFGPALLMPGQTFRLPFDRASEYQFACTAHSNGQMDVIVDPFPATPWARLRWRLHQAADRLGTQRHQPT